MQFRAVRYPLAAIAILAIAAVDAVALGTRHSVDTRTQASSAGLQANGQSSLVTRGQQVPSGLAAPSSGAASSTGASAPRSTSPRASRRRGAPSTGASTGSPHNPANTTDPLRLFIDRSTYYGGLNSASMVANRGGLLTLSAQRSGSSYLSSEVDSSYFNYGTVTVRAKLARGAGMWPAIWLAAKVPGLAGALGTPEIDMQELPQSRGGLTRIGNFTYHWTDSHGMPWSIANSLQMSFDMTTGFHIYRLSWQPGSITWWLDDIQVMHVETDPSGSTGTAQQNAGTSSARVARPTTIPVFGGPMHLRINNGVGSSGSWAGSPDGSTPFPNATQVSSISIAPRSGRTMVDRSGRFSIAA